MATGTKTKNLMLGQRLVIGFEGKSLTPELKDMIAEWQVAGVILFSPNLESPAQIAELCRSIQEHTAGLGLPPMFVAIDQEGGVVRRLKPPFTQFEGNPAMACENDAVHFAQVTARELKSVGINMNMAPVLDVAPPGLDSVMRKRVFKGDPQQVARMGAIVIEQMQKAGVMAVAKHFPGIGRTTLDSHLDLPVLDIGLDVLQSSDLVPFVRAAKQKVAGIMLSHVIYTCLDKDWPASLSPAIASRLLRRKLGYDGLIITDDLDMGAIGKHFPMPVAMEQIARCGTDISLICHQGPAMEEAYRVLEKSVSGNQEIRDIHRECLQRIMRFKSRFLCGLKKF